MKLRVSNEWQSSWRDGAPYLTFGLGVEGGATDLLQVWVPSSVAERLAPGCEKDPGLLMQPVMLLLLDRLRDLGVDGMAPLLQTRGTKTGYNFEVIEGDLPYVQRLAAEKSCKHQAAENGDLFCMKAAHPSSGDISAKPTTRFRCGGCPVPDDRLACSNFRHVAVVHQTNVTTKIVRALCELNRGEKDQDPSRCRPGGHVCWVRDVEFETPEDEPQHALALHELFAFVDARWKVAFGDHLISSRRWMAFATLTTPCETGADFEAKLSALAQVMKGIEVPDELLKDGHKDLDKYGKGKSLARMRSALERGLAGDPDSYATVEKAVDVLHAANRLRAIAQHGGTEVVAAYERFGLPYPPPPAPERWARVQSRVAQALHDLAAAIPDEPPPAASRSAAGG